MAAHGNTIEEALRAACLARDQAARIADAARHALDAARQEYERTCRVCEAWATLQAEQLDLPTVVVADPGEELVGELRPEPAE